MGKYKTPEGEVIPTSNYKMACCDCGLVHGMRFKVVRIIQRFEDGSFEYEDATDSDLRVAFTVNRNNRSTGQMRRWM